MNRLRAHSKITSHFRIPSSGHLWPFLNRKILEIIRLFLWFRSIGIAKSDPNLYANSAKLFLSEPLAKDNKTCFFSTSKFDHLVKSPKTRHSGESRSLYLFEKAGFRLLSAFGGLAGMTKMVSVQLFTKPLSLS